MIRWATRIGALIAGVVAALAFAGVALAHVAVSANPDTAGAPDAVLTFTAEAENPSAGITAVRIVLPLGIATQDVALNKAPEGWTFHPTEDGYTVSGPALPQGTEAEHSIIVTHLPNMNELAFKTLVTYSDESVDRWIEEKSASNPNPEHPAPVLTVKVPEAAAASASPPAATTAVSTAGQDSLTWLWWLLAVVLVIGAGLALSVARRRRNAA